MGRRPEGRKEDFPDEEGDFSFLLYALGAASLTNGTQLEYLLESLSASASFLRERKTRRTTFEKDLTLEDAKRSHFSFSSRSRRHFRSHSFRSKTFNCSINK